MVVVSTATSHNRVIVGEVMGRYAGWIALNAGIASSAHAILIPEVPFDLHQVAETIQRRQSAGSRFSIVVVAEGALPIPGTLDLPEAEIDQWGRPKLGGMGDIVGVEIARRTGFDTRVTVLGHVQRGGTPTAYDRVLCTRFGVAAVDAAHAGHGDHMVALRSNAIDVVPLTEVVGQEKRVDPDLYRTASVFFS